MSKESYMSFCVPTPHGVLEVWEKNDADSREAFPGIVVSLKQPDGDDRPLLMLEYVPRGAESMCGFDPEHPEKNARERAEVPMERRVGEIITEGFLTRVWPNPMLDEDDHIRIFHHGYTPAPSSEKVASHNAIMLYCASDHSVLYGVFTDREQCDAAKLAICRRRGFDGIDEDFFDEQSVVLNSTVDF